MTTLRLAVAGAGMIGQRHVEMIRAHAGATLSAVVDPAPHATAYARAVGVPLFPSIEALFAADKPDGIVLATPNQAHESQALACIAASVPALIEKPIAHSLDAAIRIQDAADKTGARMMVGHHRQHGSVMAKAVEIVGSGALGRIVAIVCTTLYYKAENEGYFDGSNAWRREPGGGPVMINLIHEIGNLRALAGDIVEVQAFTSNATRGFAVEDTAAITLRFASGALGTITLSDTAATNRNWEHTSGEDAFRFGKAHTDTHDCYVVTGTWGTLAIPTMRLQRYASEPDRSWHKPLGETTVPLDVTDPLAAQIANFCDVISGKAEPRVSVRDGVQNLRVVAAVLASARTGRSVAPDSMGQSASI